jgi:hypothetical protein
MMIAEQDRFEVLALGKLCETFNLNHSSVVPRIKMKLEPPDAGKQKDHNNANE